MSPWREAKISLKVCMRPASAFCVAISSAIRDSASCARSAAAATSAARRCPARHASPMRTRAKMAIKPAAANKTWP